MESVTTTNSHFTDSGLFGLSIVGSRDAAGDLGKVLVEELAGLKKGITDEELQRAKNILKINILLALERQSDRLEEIVKNVRTLICIRGSSTRYSASSSSRNTWRW